MQHAPASDVRLIAFYLPQFHPIPENDEWWGKGFTEWTNVTQGHPLVRGALPTAPAGRSRLLRPAPARGACASRSELARANTGSRASATTTTGSPGSACSNARWTRCSPTPKATCLSASAGQTRTGPVAGTPPRTEVLIAQKYLPDDDLEFIRGLEPYFRDPRYIRLEGAPLLIVYRPQHLPDPARTARVWREHCRAVGIGEIHICAALTHGSTVKPAGFDSVVDFPPHNVDVPRHNASIDFHGTFAGSIFDHAEIARFCLDRPNCVPVHFRTVFPAWDNTARTGSQATIVINSSPNNYEYWLSESIKRAECRAARRPTSGLHQCLERVGGRLPPGAGSALRPCIPGGNSTGARQANEHLGLRRQWHAPPPQPGEGPGVGSVVSRHFAAPRLAQRPQTLPQGPAMRTLADAQGLSRTARVGHRGR